MTLVGWELDLEKVYGRDWRARREFGLREEIYESPGGDIAVLLYKIGEIGIDRQVAKVAVIRNKRRPVVVMQPAGLLFWYSGEDSVRFDERGLRATLLEYVAAGGDAVNARSCRLRPRVIDLEQCRLEPARDEAAGRRIEIVRDAGRIGGLAAALPLILAAAGFLRWGTPATGTTGNAALAILFVLLALFVMLGRWRVVLDGAGGTVTEWLGVLRPMRIRIRAANSFECVAINEEMEALAIRLEGKQERMFLEYHIQREAARRRAEEYAGALGLPLVDRSAGFGDQPPKRNAGL